MAGQLQEIRQHRALRRLLDPARLVELLEIPCADDELRAQVAAELVVRAWLLSGGGTDACAGIEQCLKRGLRALNVGTGDIGKISAWCRSQGEARTFTLPSALVHSKQTLWNLIAYDLENWRTADGFILFVPNNGAMESGYAREGVALPFILDDTATSRTGLLRTTDDSPIADPSLTRAIRVAHVVARTAGWLHPEQCPAVKLLSVQGGGLPIQGESAGMPVLLALALRSRKRVEGFSLGLGASGVLAENGGLAPGEHGESELLAKEHLLCMMGVSHRFLPPGPRYMQADTVRLPQTHVVDALRGSLEGIGAGPASGNASGCLSLSEIEDHLMNIQRGMRYGSMTATAAKSQCERILAQIGSSLSIREADLRIWATANLASAECHLGHPKRAAELCQRVVDAPACGVRYKAQALVRQVVNLTDVCRYEDAVRTAQEAVSLIDGLPSTTERVDMELQITGSMGQALCYWALIDPGKADKAFRTLEKNCDLAKQMDGEPPTDTPDLPRSRCYWYLAHALLKPNETETIYRQVHDVCSSHPKTREYLLRTRWLSAYRMHLLELPLPATLVGLDMELPSPKADGWLNQTAAKYRGALRAAQGDIEGACRDFAVAAKLTECGDRSPLLEFIGATACLQAGESLIAVAPNAAHDHLVRAAIIFRKRRDWFSGVLTGEKWLTHVMGVGKEPIHAERNSPHYFYPY